jgi:glycosyltransferase involved in cell wall biosynthesis
MKVLAVIDSFSFGGAERLLATLAKALPGVGVELEVASLAPYSAERTGMLPVLSRSGVPLSFLSIPRLAHPAAIPRLVAAIRRSGCDLVHAHLGYSATLVPPAAAISGRPAVCSFHTVRAPLRGREAVKERLAVAVASRSAALIFVSRASMRAFAELYHANPRTWTVVPNGVDLNEFGTAPETFPPDLGIPAGVPVAALVAAMRGPKRHADAVAAWPSVIRRVAGARLLLVGGGPEERALRAQARALGLGDHVIFAGYRSDVPRLLRASSLVILPSETEALPTTLIEAAACGRPAVATNVGGVAEVVSDGETGLLVPAGDPVRLADAAAGLFADPARRAAMGAAARRIATERFDMHRWARRLRAVYDDALAGRPVAPATGEPVELGGTGRAGEPGRARRAGEAVRGREAGG